MWAARRVSVESMGITPESVHTDKKCGIGWALVRAR